MLDKWLEKNIDAVLINLDRQNNISIKRRSQGELDEYLSILLLERMNRNERRFALPTYYC